MIVVNNISLKKFFLGLQRAAEIAVQDINALGMLPGLQLTLEGGEGGGCDPFFVVKEFIEFSKVDNLMGVIGPACSESINPIVALSDALTIPIVSYAAEGGSFLDRSTYPYIYRTIGDSKQ